MLDGLYCAKFVTPIASGAGVVVKTGTRLRGGDSAFAWTGEINDDGQTISGTLAVLKHDQAMSSVFGPLTDYALNIDGTSDTYSAKLNATAPDTPEVLMTISLARLSD